MENMERRTFVKLLGLIGAAVGLGVKQDAAEPIQPQPAPEILEAQELTISADPICTDIVDGCYTYAPGLQTAEWTVYLKPNSPWVQRLYENIGGRIEIQAGTKERLFSGHAFVTMVEECYGRGNIIDKYVVKLVSDGPVRFTVG